MSSMIPSKTQQLNGNGSLAKWSGFPVFNQFRQEMDRVFQRFFGDVSFFDNEKPSWGVDLEEKDNSVIARFEAPGFDAKEIDLKQVGNELVLKAEHKSEVKDKECSEERRSSLFRSITLPEGCIMDKAEAKFQNGLLTVAIPKVETARGKPIAIQSTK
ncbi:MAG TPA: Hsp20/alpha crystallin family protein [Gemmatales bacterium]|nr:Hsp20/alpha crystallin family protein [Gemmatales bacterium]